MAERMIERVARELYPTAFSALSRSKLAQGAEQARALGKARAAIAAMREPTDRMVKAGSVFFDMSEDEAKVAARIVFTDMIDATLEDGR